MVPFVRYKIAITAGFLFILTDIKALILNFKEGMALSKNEFLTKTNSFVRKMAKPLHCPYSFCVKRHNSVTSKNTPIFAIC